MTSPGISESVSAGTDWREEARRLGAAPHLRPRRLARNVVAVLLLIVAAVFVVDLVLRPVLGWPVIWRYMFAPTVLQGIGNMLLLTVLSMSLALVASVVIANMRLSGNPVLRGIAGVYVWFFRSIPLLVLLILWYNIAIIYPRIVVGVPFGPEWWSIDTSDVVNGFWAAVLAFGLQQAAYTSEVIRASLLAIPVGQREAAAAIGMTKPRLFFRIILPQAMRIAVPPIGNDTINLLKATALVAFIAVPDLLYSVQTIYNRTYEIVPLLMVATIWYAVFVSILSYGQHHLERALSRDRKAARA